VVLFDEDAILVECGVHFEPIRVFKRGCHDFGHHAPPGDNVGVYALLRFLLMVDDGLEQAVEVAVSRVIELLKGVEALGQVRAQLRGVVIAEGGVVGVVLVAVVV
jgi:hypothetical protein